MSHGPPPVEGLRVSRDGSVLRLTLCAPERRNAQTPALWRAFARIGADLDPGVTGVLLSAEGPSFSAGLDRRMFSAEGLAGEPPLVETAQRVDLPDWIKELQRGFRVWQEVDAVVVAAVQGHAIGAGFQLALAADAIVAAEDAVFAMREATLGLVPDLGGTSSLMRSLGYHRAFDICATGRDIDAAEALRLGFVSAVVPIGQLQEAAATTVDRLSSTPFDSVRAIKRLLRDHDRAGVEEQYRREREAQAHQLRSIVATLTGSA